jgi:hypothetical protein
VNTKGNVSAPSTATAIGELVSFNNATGTLLRQGAAKITDNQTGAITTNGATISANTDGNIITQQQIYDWVFCNLCTTGGTYDAIRGVGIANVGTTTQLVNGVAGYVMASAPIAGAFPTAVALFGQGIADANGSSVWGINTALSDNRGLFASTGTGKTLNNELDLSFTSPSTTGIGLVIQGVSPSQPAFALGFSCGPLDLFNVQSNTTPRAQWSQCFQTADWSTQVGLILGRQGGKAGTPNLNSQVLALGYDRSDGTAENVSFYAGFTGGLIFQATDAAVKQVTLTNVNMLTGNVTTPNTVGVGIGLTATGASAGSQRLNFSYNDASSVLHAMALLAPGGPLQILELFSDSGPAYMEAGTTFIAGNMPTSCTGLPTGTLWNSGGTVHVC